ncbi:TPA: conjugal transfer protein TraP [Escherichia coli]|uniref:conjugal transfer protein TraP n=1 Tax=Enterobacteriaceae TaxID=543 RepID=UPI000584289A|nr:MULTISPECIES: conjugal transfer protein TraP [Enterobacteriaceae]EAW5725110.1 TraP [Salmonella enterica]ECN1572738.1 TraP [Salmonella enterica subsp. enterica serovar Typhimurium]ECU8439339.1 TraP [Salmonella enterica subsp. enterica serovar Enteritidis]EDE1719660.1 conjugal transfer protein TraP [Salmonella enterica subsp. enterica serovar Newport]EEE2639629.1 conjugal transfer protein TraP [Salmonella enterica subsp. enterica serovar Paratyphi B]EFO2288666.1 TraP [Escherichia coli O148]
MNLFEDDNKNEAAPAQEPVSAKPAEKPKPTVTPAAKASKKPLNISDYAWIGGIAVITILLLVWLFGGSDSDTAPATGNGAIQSSAQRPRVQSAPAGQDSGDFREQISGILLQQKERLDAIESTSKNGMMILSSQLQSANEQIKNLNNQVQELKMKAAGYGPSFGNQSGTISGSTSQALPLLRGFSINDLSGDLAWVKYKNQTYAVKVGSQLGGVTITGIDTENRIVTTSKGLIR